MMKDRSSDTIAAVATAMSSSGIGIVRVSGSDAFSIVNEIFESKKKNFDLRKAPSHRVHYGMIKDGEEILDEVLVIAMRGPHSYTAEDTVELPRRCPGNEKNTGDSNQIWSPSGRAGRIYKTGIFKRTDRSVTGRGCDGCDSFKK